MLLKVISHFLFKGDRRCSDWSVARRSDKEIHIPPACYFAGFSLSLYEEEFLFIKRDYENREGDKSNN